jgi:hypothetical protein
MAKEIFIFFLVHDSCKINLSSLPTLIGIVCEIFILMIQYNLHRESDLCINFKGKLGAIIPGSMVECHPALI